MGRAAGCGLRAEQAITDMRASTLVVIVLSAFVIGLLVGEPQRGLAQAGPFYAATDSPDAARRRDAGPLPGAGRPVLQRRAERLSRIRC
jgi:hypothetical protein